MAFATFPVTTRLEMRVDVSLSFTSVVVYDVYFFVSVCNYHENVICAFLLPTFFICFRYTSTCLCTLAIANTLVFVDTHIFRCFTIFVVSAFIWSRKAFTITLNTKSIPLLFTGFYGTFAHESSNKSFPFVILIHNTSIHVCVVYQEDWQRSWNLLVVIQASHLCKIDSYFIWTIMSIFI